MGGRSVRSSGDHQRRRFEGSVARGKGWAEVAFRQGNGVPRLSEGLLGLVCDVACSLLLCY